jgi:hypothetical protein
VKRLDILDVISKQIVTINLVMSVRPSVRLEQRDRNLTISFLGLLIKYVDTSRFWLQSDMPDTT